MDKNTLIKILNTGSVEFSLQEVEQLMDEELEKPSEEMDAELVDLCLQILVKEPEKELAEKPKTKAKRFRFTKILIAAALLAVLLVLSLPATADIYDIDVSENTIVQKFGDFFKITILEERDINLTEAFRGIDLSENTLPDFLFDENCEIYDLKSEISGSEGHINFSFKMKDSEMTGQVNIDVAKGLNSQNYNTFNIDGSFSQIKEMQVDDTKIFVFSNTNGSILEYKKDDMRIFISLEKCDFEYAKEIACSIG